MNLIAETSFAASRGKEATEEVMEVHAEAIFQEAEHRLHAQKAVMSLLVVQIDGGKSTDG